MSTVTTKIKLGKVGVEWTYEIELEWPEGATLTWHTRETWKFAKEAEETAEKKAKELRDHFMRPEDKEA